MPSERRVNYINVVDPIKFSPSGHFAKSSPLQRSGRTGVFEDNLSRRRLLRHSIDLHSLEETTQATTSMEKHIESRWQRSHMARMPF